MSDTSDSLTKLRQRTAPVTTAAAAAPAPPSDDADIEAITVAQMNGKVASMRPANKNLTRLHVVLKDAKVVSYQYNFLDAQSTFDGGTFTLLFAGVRHWQVTVKGYGPDFWRVYDLVTLHRWPYLREATGSMPGMDGETVLTEIKIVDVTPSRE